MVGVVKNNRFGDKILKWFLLYSYPFISIYIYEIEFINFSSY